MSTLVIKDLEMYQELTQQEAANPKGAYYDYYDEYGSSISLGDYYAEWGDIYTYDGYYDEAATMYGYSSEYYSDASWYYEHS